MQSSPVQGRVEDPDGADVGAGADGVVVESRCLSGPVPHHQVDAVDTHLHHSGVGDDRAHDCHCREALEKLWSASAFMGADTTTERLEQVAAALDCAYNSVGYREQIRAQMSGVAVADVVPNASPLQPILVDSPYGSKIVAQATPNGGDATNVGSKAVPR